MTDEKTPSLDDLLKILVDPLTRQILALLMGNLEPVYHDIKLEKDYSEYRRKK